MVFHEYFISFYRISRKDIGAFVFLINVSEPTTIYVKTFILSFIL